MPKNMSALLADRTFNRTNQDSRTMQSVNLSFALKMITHRLWYLKISLARTTEPETRTTEVL